MWFQYQMSGMDMIYPFPCIQIFSSEDSRLITLPITYMYTLHLFQFPPSFDSFSHSTVKDAVNKDWSIWLLVLSHHIDGWQQEQIELCTVSTKSMPFLPDCQVTILDTSSLTLTLSYFREWMWRHNTSLNTRQRFNHIFLSHAHFPTNWQQREF